MTGRTIDDVLACLRRNWHKWALAVGIMALIIAGYLAAIGERVEDRRQRVADAQESRRYVCERVNALPVKLARALALSEQRRQILGPTTTVVPVDLTPDEQAELEQINAELAEVIADLGDPIDCDLAATGQTTTTSRSPAPTNG